MTDIQHIETRRVLVVRETIAVPQLPEFQGRAFLAIWTALQVQGATSSEHPYVRYHSISDTDMDVEVGLPVEPTIVGDDTVTVGSLHEGPALTHFHIGGHESLGQGYQALAEGDAPGLVPAGAPWEVYQWIAFERPPDPATWPPQEQWRTTLVQPLRPRS